MYDFVSNFGNFVVLVEFGVSVKKSLKTKILKKKHMFIRRIRTIFKKKNDLRSHVENAHVCDYGSIGGLYVKFYLKS